MTIWIRRLKTGEANWLFCIICFSRFGYEIWNEVALKDRELLHITSHWIFEFIPIESWLAYFNLIGECLYWVDLVLKKIATNRWDKQIFQSKSLSYNNPKIRYAIKMFNNLIRSLSRVAFNLFCWGYVKYSTTLSACNENYFFSRSEFISCFYHKMCCVPYTFHYKSIENIK